MGDRIDRYMIEHRDDMVRDISALIRIESLNGDSEGTEKALDYVLNLAEEMGMKTKKSSKGDVGVVEIGQGEEIVGVLTHVDVVGTGDLSKWKAPPFEGRVEDGVIWGRGALDDKGAVIMSLYAFKAIKELDIRLRKRLWLIVGTSEEGEWYDMRTFKEEFETPTFGYSPDGPFPIYNREKGYCDVELIFSEPEADIIENVHAGENANSVPSAAVMKIKGQKEMVFTGVGCHSSVPQEGVNAIEKLAESRKPGAEFNFVRFINDMLAKDPGGVRLGIDPPDMAGKPLAEKTSAVPTLLFMRDGKVVLNINLRPWFTATEEKIRETFQKHSGTYGYEVKVVSYQAPMEVSENMEFLRLMAEIYEKYGYRNRFMTAQGTSYAKAVDNFVCWGPVFEDEDNSTHKENERITVDAMVLASRVYASYLAEIGASEKSGVEVTGGNNR